MVLNLFGVAEIPFGPFGHFFLCKLCSKVHKSTTQSTGRPRLAGPVIFNQSINQSEKD